MIPRLIIEIVALCRIAGLINRLKQFGYLSNRLVIWLHLLFVFFETFFAFYVGGFVYFHVWNSLEIKKCGEDEGKTVYCYNVNPYGVAHGLAFYQLYIVVNHSMMLTVCHKILQYIRNSLEKKEELYVSVISSEQ